MVHVVVPGKRNKMLTLASATDFGVEPGRYDSSHVFLGDGIFNTDGKVWKRSRAVLRPQFAKAQVNDFRAQEKHIQRLLALISRNGFTEIFGTFGCYSLDSNTEFAFGTCTDTLIGGDTALENSEMTLASAISVVERGLQKRGDLGNTLAWFFM